jgi:hypothetical protein
MLADFALVLFPCMDTRAHAQGLLVLLEDLLDHGLGAGFFFFVLLFGFVMTGSPFVLRGLVESLDAKRPQDLG